MQTGYNERANSERSEWPRGFIRTSFRICSRVHTSQCDDLHCMAWRPFFLLFKSFAQNLCDVYMTNKNHSRFVGSIICVFVGAKLGGKYILFNQLISNGPKWSETGWIIAHLKVSCTSTQEKWERPHFTKTSLVINGAKLIMRSVHWVKSANHASILFCHPAGQWCRIIHVYKLGGRNFQGHYFH